MFDIQKPAVWRDLRLCLACKCLLAVALTRRAQHGRLGLGRRALAALLSRGLGHGRLGTHVRVARVRVAHRRRRARRLGLVLSRVRLGLL